MIIVEEKTFLKSVLFGCIMTGSQVYAQSNQESYENYDKCQVNEPVCQQSAERGDVIAQYNLGKMYYMGEGVPQNYNMAKKLWEQAASKGNPQAKNGLGTIYYSGKGLKQQDINLARELFIQAARQGEYKALINLNKMFEDSYVTYQDLKKSNEDFRNSQEKNKRQLEQQSNNGDAEASYELSLMYTDNEVIETDIKKKIHYLEIAAKQGSATAQYDIGYIYFRGSYNVKRDKEKAREYFVQSDRQENSDAAYSLYEYYQYRQEPHTKEAFKYLEKAANRRHLQAVKEMANYYYNGEEPDLKQDYKKAFKYYKILATTMTNKALYYIGKDYQFSAMYQLGVMYRNGQGVEKSIAKANQWFKKSCDNDFQKSCNTLKK